MPDASSGRPPIGDPVQVRLSRSQLARLDQIAVSSRIVTNAGNFHQLSRAAVIRLLLDDAMPRGEQIMKEFRDRRAAEDAAYRHRLRAERAARREAG